MREANHLFGLVEAGQGDYGRARARLEDYLAVARTLDDVRAVRDCIRDLGVIALAEADYARARELLDEAVDLAWQTSNSGAAAMAIWRLSILDRLVGDFEPARARLEETLWIFREARVPEERVWSSFGNLARARGHFSQARALLIDVLRKSHERGDRAVCMEQVAWLGVLAVAEGDHRRGATLLGSAAADTRRFGTWFAPDLPIDVEASVARARIELGERDFANAWAEGEAMSWETAASVALSDSSPVAGGQRRVGAGKFVRR